MADKSSTNKFPQALAHQQRMLQSRFPPARASDDDARSDASWTTVRTSEVGEAETLGAGADQHQGRGMDPIAEEVKNVPPPPATQNAWGNPTPPSAAPVNQAARNLLDHANEPPAARRLRRQQEKAERRGRRGSAMVRWVPTMLAMLSCLHTSGRWDPKQVNVLC